MEMPGQAPKPHILALPLPLQGHINPMMQLCKRLVSRGLKVTIIATDAITNGLLKDENNSVEIELIEEYTGEVEAADSVSAFFERFRITITNQLGALLEKKDSSCDPVRVILYDSLIPWALDHVQDLGFPAAVFFTQACAVANIYNHIFRGTLKVPLENLNISLPSMPQMEANDLPSFVSNPTAYPHTLELVLSQNKSLEKADWILFNTFDNLECEVVSWMRNFYRVKTVGPTIPSFYLDKRLKEDNAYSFNLFQSANERCMKWLDSKQNASVIYVSFGSLSELGEDQTEEIALGIVQSNCKFLWTVRATEQSKLPSSLMMSVGEERGLIVEWCPQLEVLAHKAVGCFLTHCGWNSTLEALSLGVPMVAVPLGSDQPTNSKYIADVWQVGSRAKTSEEGIVSREELESSIREVMYGEKANEMKENAIKWKEKALQAACQGGSSDQCIQEFVGDVKALG